jgi:CubicO group peptidase (beta-lactamase class C family)
MDATKPHPRRTPLAAVIGPLLALAVAAAGCTADPESHSANPDDVDQVALQEEVPEVAELLRVAGHHPERLAEPELSEVELDHAGLELAGRLAVPATVGARAPIMYSGGGLGCDVPEFASSRFAGFDQVAEDLGSQWGIMSLTLAVSNECGTLYQQGYGLTGPWWARNALPGEDLLDVFSMGDPMPADGLFRVASIVKPITAAAIHELDEAGDLAKDDFAFCVPGGPSNCILTVPLPDGFDERIGDITVRHLVGHRGGFDRGETAEYLFRAWETYQARNLGAPPTEEDFVAHMLGFGLDFDPDATSVYSNLGYLILGMVIEQVSGQSYRDYVYDTLMAPLGIGPDEVVLSRTKRSQRDPREPAYWCKEQDWGGYSPVSTFPGEVGEDRCWADGGWVLEAMAAHGGLSMTASAVATFYAHWWNFGNPRDGEDYWAFPDGTQVARSHNGKLAATSTVAARCVNGLNVSLLTN